MSYISRYRTDKGGIFPDSNGFGGALNSMAGHQPKSNQKLELHQRHEIFQLGAAPTEVDGRSPDSLKRIAFPVDQ